MKSRVRVLFALGGLIGVVAISSAFAAPGRELLFSAPIQQLDRTTDTVTVLGQPFHAQTAQLSIGQIVNVYGLLQKDGSVADALVQGTQAFGANGDRVFLKGVVTNVDLALGRAEVDGLNIDYTPELGNSDFVAPSVGDVIAVSGAQPVSKGILVAMATGDRAYIEGMNGGGTTIGGGMGGSNAGVSAPGTTVAGMSGGGTATAGMSGGGTAAAGMSGGGTAAAGMSGGGTATAGMSGGGVSTAGMSGGGR